jgi:small conductance mechanosensitive channel
VPNRLLYAGTISNATREPMRRVDLLVPVSYAADAATVLDLIRGSVDADERVLREPPAEVAVQDLLPAGVNIAVRAWVNTDEYSAVRSELLARIKHMLDQRGWAVGPGALPQVQAQPAAPSEPPAEAVKVERRTATSK